MSKWGGRKAQAWTAAVLREKGKVCWLRLPGCTVVATTGDHVIPRSERPDLQYDVANGRPACLPCNQRRGRRPAASRPAVDARPLFDSTRTPGTDLRTSPPRASRKPDGRSGT